MLKRTLLLKVAALMDAMENLQQEGEVAVAAITPDAATAVPPVVMQIGVTVPVTAVRREGRGPHPRTLVGSRVRVTTAFSVIGHDDDGTLRIVPADDE